MDRGGASKWCGRKKENLQATCAPVGIAKLLSSSLPRTQIPIGARKVLRSHFKTVYNELILQ